MVTQVRWLPVTSSATVRTGPRQVALFPAAVGFGADVPPPPAASPGRGWSLNHAAEPHRDPQRAPSAGTPR